MFIKEPLVFQIPGLQREGATSTHSCSAVIRCCCCCFYFMEAINELTSKQMTQTHLYPFFPPLPSAQPSLSGNFQASLQHGECPPFPKNSIVT